MFCVIADENKTVRDFGKGEHQRGGDVSVDHRPGLAIEARAATAPQHFAGIAPTRATPDQADRVREARKSEAQQEQELVLLQMIQPDGSSFFSFLRCSEERNYSAQKLSIGTRFLFSTSFASSLLHTSVVFILKPFEKVFNQNW